MNKKNAIVMVGLGNPGRKYTYTPHNAGFAMVDELKYILASDGIAMKETNKKEVAILEATLAERTLLLIKPLLFMNRSGEAIKRLSTNYKLKTTNYICLIHDDIDLPLGTIRIQSGGGAAGHKGVASIIEVLGENTFLRVRIGVLHLHMPQKRSPELMNEYVTKKLRGENKKKFIQTVRSLAQLIAEALLHDRDLKELVGDHTILTKENR